MNGVHDMGGMQGFGPVQPEANEPVFHGRWEARVLAMRRAMGAWRKWNIDAGRYSIETASLNEHGFASEQSAPAPGCARPGRRVGG